MTRQEADKVMLERFETLIAKAQTVETSEDEVRYTDCAHKLYLTLASAGVFEANQGEAYPMGS